ncbi:NAD(P)-binding protein [Amylostereum chailletii]|nr:NAD(P)-binding protein [Amylostereum chailletii]
MRVLILGGTGNVGVRLIEAALAEKHTIVVYARAPKSLPAHIATHRDVVVIQGQLTEEDALSKAMEGVQIVLSALGPSPALHPGGTPLAKGYRVVLRLMEHHRVRRIILLGSPSMKDERDKPTVVFTAARASVQAIARNAYKEMVAIGKVINEAPEGIDWTIVRVSRLMNGERREVVAGYLGEGKIGTAVTRAGFAAFVMEEIQKQQWTRQRPLICTP